MSEAGGMPTQAGKVRLAVTACFVRSGHITSDRLGAQIEVLSANKRTAQVKLVSGQHAGQVLHVPKEEMWRAVCYESYPLYLEPTAVARRHSDWLAGLV